MKSLFLISITTLLCTLVGCGKAPELSPPEIHFGQDTCHECGMILEDERFASAVIVVVPGESLQTFLFDDPGEMLAYAPPAAATQTVWYVRDAQTKQWLDATKATFIKSEKHQTPMGSGIAAYANESSARAVTQTQDGEITSFDKLHINNRK